MGRDFKRFREGGMDSDSSIPDVNGIDYLQAFNIRVTGTTETEFGEVTNIESTTQITPSRHSGINKCIGAVGFETLRTGYAVIYNSQGFHQLIEVDYDTLTETVLFENKTDSNGVDIWPLNPQFYFNDIKLFQDKFLILTDNYGEVYYFNIDRLKSGYYTYLTTEDIYLIKAQPLRLPVAVYNDDAGRSVNLLKDRLFQFIEQYERLDDEFSAWSSRSKRVVPENEPTPSVGTDVTKSNNLIVSVDAGSDRVKRLNIAARYDMLDWFLIKSIDRSTVVALPNTAVDVSQEIYEAYDPATNTYSFAFYNDGLYNNIDVLETDNPYDYIAKKSGVAEIINGSILVLGDLTEGYPRPAMSVNISVSSYDPHIAITPTVPDSLRVTNVTNRRLGQFEPLAGGVEHKRLVTVTYAGLPKTGDDLYIQLRDIRDSTNVQLYAYTVPFAQQDNLSAVLASFSTGIPTSSVSGSTITIVTTPYFELDFARIVLQNADSGASKSIHSIKTNSAYQMAFAHYDDKGRYFPLVSDERFQIKTLSYAQTHGLVPQIDWRINSLPPAGATSGQWLISLNNTHETDLYVSGIYDAGRSDNDYIVFNISSLVKFNETNTSSILNYEYSTGDRCTFMFTYSGSNTPIKWFDSPSIDVEVVGLDIVTTAGPPETTSYYLRVRKSSSLNIADITSKNIILEVYSPKKRTVTSSSGTTTLATTLFYEFGERITITNGQYDQTSGTIREADAYFKTRSYVGSTDSLLLPFTVESFDFSDFYKSDYTSYGRARLYDDEQGETRKKASIRYSDMSVLGSKVNGISRFYGERIYGDGAGETSSSYGAIGKLRMRDNYLVCLQELKVGHIPVNISIIEDQAEQRQVAVSDKLLNFIRYLPGNYGIGTAKESYGESQNGTIYFIDPNNSLPIRDGYDGLKVISGKMTKYFRRVFKQARKDGKKIIGYFDNFNNEYNVSIEVKSNIVTSFPFNSTDWKFTDDYIDLDTIVVTSTSHGTVDVFPEGVATFTPDEDYVGSAGFTFTFEDGDGNTVTKNVCITVIAGDTTINDFFFIDLVNQELSTLLDSNSVLIIGNNIPVPISITGGEYSIDSGPWTSSAGMVSQGASVKVRQTSSASYLTTTSATLTVSGYSDSFDVTTKSNETPDPFVFVDETNAELSTIYISNLITISGLGTTAPISIVGGEYRINGGSWVSTAGTIGNGDTVEVRNTSSASYEDTVDATLTVGGYSDTYSITTKPEPTSSCVGYSLSPVGPSFSIEYIDCEGNFASGTFSSPISICTDGSGYNITAGSATETSSGPCP